MSRAAKASLIAARGGLYRALMRAIGALCPIDRNKAVFVSFGGHAYSDNPRAVSEALCAVRPRVKPVWLFSNPKKPRPSMPAGVISARIHSLAALYHMATASAWVLNGLMPSYAVKRCGQFYVQTWHGDRMFKVCLHNSGRYGLPDVPVMDVGIIGSDQGEMFFRTAFKFPGELMRVGSPRNDALIHVDEAEAQRTREALGIAPGEKVAMYAPTMREHLGHTKHQQDVSAIDFVRVLDLLEAKDGKRWRLIVRAHSTVAGLKGYAADPRILDLSDYEDMRDLIVITDLLMTDYSSCACDFPLTGRPVALFQPDIAEYQALDRALYFQMSDSPYWVAVDQAGLEAILQNITDEAARENDEAILRFFGTDESGEAATRVAERIAAHMDGH